MTEESRGGAGRWIVMLLVVGLAGFAGYIGFQKWSTTNATDNPTAEVTADNPRMSMLLTEGYRQLDAGRLDAALEQFQKASGIAESHPEVQEALCAAKVVRAEGSFLQLHASAADARTTPLALLEKDVERAHQCLAQARKHKPPALYFSRLNAFERQLNSWQALAYVAAGKAERAGGSFQARLGSHPHAQLLRDVIKHAGGSISPAASASASTSASAESSASAVAAAAPPPGHTRPRERPYEFDHEPVVDDLAGANELKLPAKPSPAPAPAPTIDDSDLP